MPNTISTYVAANYRRAFAPFTRFNTRKLAFFQISCYGLSDGTLTDEELSDQPNPYFEPTAEIEYTHNGYFMRAIQGVETRAEIHGVFRPGDGRGDSDGNSFIVMVAIDTANVGSTNEELNSDGNPANYNDNSTSIAEAVSDALDGEYVEVYQMRIRGGDFRYTDLNGLEVTDKAQAKVASAGRRP
jgi:hypothetical protein